MGIRAVDRLWREPTLRLRPRTLSLDVSRPPRPGRRDVPAVPHRLTATCSPLERRATPPRRPRPDCTRWTGIPYRPAVSGPRHREEVPLAGPMWPPLGRASVSIRSADELATGSPASVRSATWPGVDRARGLVARIEPRRTPCGPRRSLVGPLGRDEYGARACPARRPRAHARACGPRWPPGHEAGDQRVAAAVWTAPARSVGHRAVAAASVSGGAAGSARGLFRCVPVPVRHGSVARGHRGAVRSTGVGVASRSVARVHQFCPPRRVLVRRSSARRLP